MTDETDTLITLAGYFAILSLFAIGGVNAAVPEMYRLSVEVEHWMTSEQFAHMFAIAQFTPGPNAIIATLVGYQAAGFTGAVVATAALTGPSCVFAYYVGRIWERFREANWRNAIQAGLIPISIGLLSTSSLILARANSYSVAAIAIMTVTAIVSYTTRLNPLWLFVAAAIIGGADLL